MQGHVLQWKLGRLTRAPRGPGCVEVPAPGDVKLIAGSALYTLPKEEETMATVERIPADVARDHLVSNPGTILVCAYNSDEKFREHHLEGAIPLSQFEAGLNSTPPNREIIFYCA
jgi:hypothetical protein